MSEREEKRGSREEANVVLSWCLAEWGFFFTRRRTTQSLVMGLTRQCLAQERHRGAFRRAESWEPALLEEPGEHELSWKIVMGMTVSIRNIPDRQTKERGEDGLCVT